MKAVLQELQVKNGNNLIPLFEEWGVIGIGDLEWTEKGKATFFVYQVLYFQNGTDEREKINIVRYEVSQTNHQDEKKNDLVTSLDYFGKTLANLRYTTKWDISTF